MQVDFLNVLKHGLTAVLLNVEIIISRVPFTTTWVLAPLLYTLVYSFFMFIYWASAHEWVYDVLDWRQPINLAYYAIVPIFQVVAFFIECVLLLHRLACLILCQNDSLHLHCKDFLSGESIAIWFFRQCFRIYLMCIEGCPVVQPYH
jgi:hypothetical protein